MKEERRVFVVIGVVVLLFIFLLPAIISFFHPYSYVDKDKSDNKKDETTENNNVQNDGNKDETTNTQSISKVTKATGEVKCTVKDDNEILSMEVSDTITYDNYKIKKVTITMNTTYKDVEMLGNIDEFKKSIEKDNELWVGIDGITVNATYNEETNTVTSTVEMDLSKGNSFQNSDKTFTYETNYIFDTDINEILTGDTYLGFVCEEL